MSKYIVYNSKTNRYFKDGDFIANSRDEASLLDKDKAEELERMLNGITTSKPVKIKRV